MTNEERSDSIARIRNQLAIIQLAWDSPKHAQKIPPAIARIVRELEMWEEQAFPERQLTCPPQIGPSSKL